VGEKKTNKTQAEISSKRGADRGAWCHYPGVTAHTVEESWMVDDDKQEDVRPTRDSSHTRLNVMETIQEYLFNEALYSAALSL
jgi:hypothetical protein